MQPVIEIKGLNFEIEDKKILQDIDFNVYKGEFLGLIGPNGAGKTSLLRCINRINKANGIITIEGKSLNKMKARETAAKVAMMHQNTEIRFPFPVHDIVMMGRYPHQGRFSMDSENDRQITQTSMEKTDTLKYEKRSITELSGGERQRVMFARVLAQESEIMLLDEPTASLDIGYHEMLFRFSRNMCTEGKTIVAAVHDLKTAAQYCDRLVLMKSGRIIAAGTPEEVLTAENIHDCYDVDAFVYRNEITGLIDFHVQKKEKDYSTCRIHVVCGGGSGGEIFRTLFSLGCSVTCGVLYPGDSDIFCAKAMGIECVKVKPFSAITDLEQSKNTEYIEKADIVILTNIPFGNNNLKNLEALSHAKNLIIIEDEPIEKRDYTDGTATRLYDIVRTKAVQVVSSDQIDTIEKIVENNYQCLAASSLLQ